MLRAYLTYALSVTSIELGKQLIIKFYQSVSHSLLFKEGLTRTL